MSTYATTKLFHDPAQARERGKRDGITGVNNADNLPCKCDKCRAQYWIGHLEVIGNEHRQDHS